MPQPAREYPLDCPTCRVPMRLKPSQYGNGFFYGCRNYPRCKMTASAHPDGRPAATPADAETKQLRVRAHELFDTLWKGKRPPYTRSEAYLRLQSWLGLRSDEAHIGHFTKEQCKQFIEEFEKRQRERRL